MKILILMLTLCTLSAQAGTGDEVYIRGKIGGAFDKKIVKVTDSFGQTYHLSRSLFPENFEFKQGKDFAIEVPEREIEKIKIITKK